MSNTQPAPDESTSVAALAVEADDATGGYSVGAAVLRPLAQTGGDDDDDDAPRRELCVYAFADDGFLTAADALLVREGPGFITIDGTDGKNRTKVDALVAKHSRAETQALNLEQKGWPKAKGKLEAKLRHVLQTLCGDKDQEMSSLSIRAAALVLERAQLTDSSERCVQLNPGATVGHVRLDSAAVEAATVLPPPGAKKTGPPTSLLDVLGGPCRTIAGSRLVEAWLRQPSRDKTNLEKRHKAVEALRDAQDGREALRSALGTTKGARIPDVAKLCAKLRQGKATLVDLHRLHVVAQKVVPEVLAAAEAIDTDAIKDIVPPLAKASRDLRVFCDMARATLDLDYLPEVLLKPSVDEELVQHSEAMRQARDAVDEAHERVNEAFADAGLGKGASHSERSKWPIKLDADANRGFVLRSPKRYDEKSLSNVEVSGARGSPEQLEVLSYLKAGVFFTTPSLSRACSALERASSAYKKAQKTLTGELVRTAATYAPVFSRAADALATLDALQAFAHAAAFAPGGAYERPTFSDDNTVSIKNARHPVVECGDGVHFVPTDYALDDQGRLVIVTGPNMGGKSTHIRGLACLAIMAQAGSLIPADAGCTLPLFDAILARVGAGDSLQRGVSTFMAEMLEASMILRSATAQSLVIIDELGRGTSTYDGFGLAWAISEQLVRQKATCLFATHFHELTQLSESNPVKNRHVTAHVDENTGALAFLYEVADGPCTESFGIKVAELAGFPPATVTVAKRKAEELESQSGGKLKALRA